MNNSYDVKPSDDATVTTVPHQRMHEAEDRKATENTSLSPNNNQTYFADERVQVPETGHVSWSSYLRTIGQGSKECETISTQDGKRTRR